REHVRHLLVQHEPLVRATETLAFAVSQYERSIVGATQQESAAAAEVAASQTRIAEALDGYETAARRFPEGDFFIPELRSEIEAFTQSGARLLERDQARRSRLKEYWSRFEKLEAQLADPQEKAARFAGAVFASESVMQLQRALSSIREKVSTATTVASPNTIQIVASENAFGALQKQYAGDLTTFHGHDWFEQVSRSFFELVAARRGVFDAIHAFEAHAFEFREEGARASSRIVTQLVGPARRALADADR